MQFMWKNSNKKVSFSTAGIVQPSTKLPPMARPPSRAKLVPPIYSKGRRERWNPSWFEMEENAAIGFCIMIDQLVEHEVLIGVENLHIVDNEAEAIAELMIVAAVEELVDLLVTVRSLVGTLVECTLTHDEVLSEGVRREISVTASSVLMWERAIHDQSEATTRGLLEAAVKACVLANNQLLVSISITSQIIAIY